MRDSFFNILLATAQTKSDIFVITADLGFKLFDNFKKEQPSRFYNVGVAESNMIGISAGLSLCGKNVYCYSFIPFLLMRAFEQIRNNIDYHNLNVKLVGVGSGFTYGANGFTHFGLDDLALTRAFTNMTVVVPADPVEAKCFAALSCKYQGPMYIRLGRTGEPILHKKKPNLRIGKALVLRRGKNLALFAIGSMVYTGSLLADMLSVKGIEVTLVNVHTFKPIDSEIIKEIAATHKIIYSLEEHYVDGGLGTAVAEILAETSYIGAFKKIGIKRLKDDIGDADYLRRKHGLSVENLYNMILKEVKSGEW